MTVVLFDDIPRLYINQDYLECGLIDWASNNQVWHELLVFKAYKKTTLAFHKRPLFNGVEHVGGYHPRDSHEIHSVVSNNFASNSIYHELHHLMQDAHDIYPHDADHADPAWALQLMWNVNAHTRCAPLLAD